MTTATGYQMPSADGSFEKTTIERRDLEPLDVQIEIKYAGICHSDIHTARNEWGNTTYPVVPGHEIAGIVTAVGDQVTRHKVGDRVGVGCFVDSCGKCEACKKGEEQYCAEGVVQTYNWPVGDDYTKGGYSSHIVVTEHFVVAIPDGLELDVAAPLLCCGITLYSPLRHWKVEKGTRVAIIGMGGLGHIGVKLAHAMGAEVTVLSRTLSKKDDGLQFGADHYYATSESETFEKLQNSFDLILNTVSANLDLDQYLSLLAVDGTFVELGAPEHPMELSAFSLIPNRRAVAGSLVGGLRETQEMLDFCAEHNTPPEIEVISADQIDEAYDRVVASDVRYRFVIDASTM
ncbi:MAG: NAD(P)-dependent alcohol dehydrogenase [Solirubrobacteraceae bacterium]